MLMVTSGNRVRSSGLPWKNCKLQRMKFGIRAMTDEGLPVRNAQTNDSAVNPATPKTELPSSNQLSELNRRTFLKASALSMGGLALGESLIFAADKKSSVAKAARMFVSDLPQGSAPPALPLPHFPDRLHAFVWRNWQLVPTDRLAKVVGAKPADILRIGKSMGLSKPPCITADQQGRSYITVLRRNWHLLPYEQLLELLDWPAEKLAYTLRHDDGVFWKFGSLKPKCNPLKFTPESDAARTRSREIARLLAEELPSRVGGVGEPLFQFVSDLSTRPRPSRLPRPESRLSPRFCHSYFAPFGDPLRDGVADPYPDGYLARLANAGVNGAWLHIVLSKLAPFPWEPTQSQHHKERLRNLRALVARARKHGVGVYLYLNEPRTLSLAFFESRPQLKGIAATNPREVDTATLCTSVPEVQKYLTDTVASICRVVPDLAGFFTITAPEALTNCWSQHGGDKCPRCGKGTPAEVIAEVNGLFREGIRVARSKSDLIVWDWGWADAWAEGIIKRLPSDVAFMSVSEWSIPIERGGVKTVIGEYSTSTIGPGPRATKHWELARKRGLKTIAKIQAGNTWELSATPYIPALQNVAQHAANLRAVKVEGVMLGWSLGGYPSPNLEVVAELGRVDATTPEAAMLTVAQRRFGPALAPAIVQVWNEFSAAFSEFPFGGGLYTAPMQFGPANLLWAEPTNYPAGPVAFPYDDLDGWCAPYPPEVFIGQFEKVAGGFEQALAKLKHSLSDAHAELTQEEGHALAQELNVAEAAAIHFRSTANQCRFVQARRQLAAAKSAMEAAPALRTLKETLKHELALARKLYEIQMRDSRIGFEASNQYYYVPMDLAEKMLNCRDLLTRWLPAKHVKWQQ